MMRTLEGSLLLAGAIYLVIGMGLGLYMGGTQNFALAPLHAHINLVGFVLHTGFALVYRVFPELKASWLASAHVYSFLVGTPILLVGLWFVLVRGQGALVAIGSVAVFASILLFAFNILSLSFGSARTRESLPTG
jgi:hypothetical protein